MDGFVKSLHTYPVKSLGGISAKSLDAKKTGLEFDRHWMLVDDKNHFITQRKYPQMALFKLSKTEPGFTIHFGSENISFPAIPGGEKIKVEVWGDTILGAEVSTEINNWITDRIGLNVKMVKNVEFRDVGNSNDKIPFSDSGPYLLINTSSLDLLNSKLKEPVDMDRFRPNIVVEGFDPHEEDTWKKIRIGDCVFRILKPCSRCKLPNVNQQTGVADRQLFQSLSQYRKAENGTVNFGVLLTLENESRLEVEDTVSILL